MSPSREVLQRPQTPAAIYSVCAPVVSAAVHTNADTGAELVVVTLQPQAGLHLPVVCRAERCGDLRPGEEAVAQLYLHGFMGA